MSIHPDTRMGAVELNVVDLDRMQQFYERSIGLRTLERSAERARLGVDEGEPLVELIGNPDAPRAPGSASGLFHLALLVPDRPSLAQSIHRVLDSGWNFTGASDHFVSEAMYLDDPEGNGIELYRDRPREEWSHDGGELRMGTVPLDVDSIMRELAEPGSGDGMPPGTTMGHVHLKVAEIPGSAAFYEGLLGFDVTVRTYPSALFLSAGGYHHHLGMNIWASAGAPAPAAGTRGLRRYRIVLPNRDELDRLADALDGAEPDGDGVTVTDPSGNVALLTAK